MSVIYTPAYMQYLKRVEVIVVFLFILRFILNKFSLHFGIFVSRESTSKLNMETIFGT